MKKISFRLYILFAFLFSACQEKPGIASHSVNVTIISDVTGVKVLLPIAEPILKLYEFNNDKNREAFFRIAPISDKHLNPATEYHLLDGSATENDNEYDDPYYREKMVLQFYSRIKKKIAEFSKDSNVDSPLSRSECFSTIAHELQIITFKKAEKNFLLVFSDLQENSSLFNCYSSTNQNLLNSKPDSVVNLFNATNLLPSSIKDIRVVFVYQPKTRKEDIQFDAVVNIYRKLLVQRGATVAVQANDNYLN